MAAAEQKDQASASTPAASASDKKDEYDDRPNLVDLDLGSYGISPPWGIRFKLSSFTSVIEEDTERKYEGCYEIVKRAAGVAVTVPSSGSYETVDVPDPHRGGAVSLRSLFTGQPDDSPSPPPSPCIFLRFKNDNAISNDMIAHLYNKEYK
jgi:hypothetical protein